MKNYNIKLLFILLVLLLSVPIAYSQDEFPETTIKEFEDTVTNLALLTGQTMSFNGLNSRSLTSYHIGNFPHFSFGWSGALALNISNLEDIGTKLENTYAVATTFFTQGQDTEFFDLITGVGFAIPISLRVGGASAPFDVGFQFMYIPLNIAKKKISLLNVGFDIRFAVLEEQLRLPGISIGLAYFHQNLSLEGKTGELYLSGTTSANNDIAIRFVDPKYDVSLATHSFSMPIQLSKKIVFFEPTLGIEPYFSIVDFSFKRTGDAFITSDGTIFLDYSTFIDTVGETISSGFFIERSGDINFNSRTFDGGLRLFTGFSLVIGKVWFFDVEVSYEPIRSNVGATIGNRFTF